MHIQDLIFREPMFFNFTVSTYNVIFKLLNFKGSLDLFLSDSLGFYFILKHLLHLYILQLWCLTHTP